MSKQIDEKTYFETQYRAGAWASGQAKAKPGRHKGRGEVTESSWNKVFVNTKLPYDVNFRFGRFQFDWEGDHGLYTDEDAAFGDWRADGFEFTKNGVTSEELELSDVIQAVKEETISNSQSMKVCSML